MIILWKENIFGIAKLLPICWILDFFRFKSLPSELLIVQSFNYSNYIIVSIDLKFEYLLTRGAILISFSEFFEIMEVEDKSDIDHSDKPPVTESMSPLEDPSVSKEESLEIDKNVDLVDETTNDKQIEESPVGESESVLETPKVVF